MVLDTVFFDTYKQYKAGTSRVMTWLASSANETNCLNDLFTTASPARLKGKARAAQKSNGRRHHISLSEIPRIAKAIVSTTKNAVPETIIRALEEVIAARSACNECFQKQGPKDVSTQASNQKHQHFIGILRETLQILEPLRNDLNQARKNKPKAGAAGAGKDAAEPANLFEHLEIEEPNEWTSSALPPKSAKSPCTYELEPTDEDVSFAIFCFLKDLTDIRYYVQQTWAEYREYQIAFTTAALTMNTAISIFRRLNEEFTSNFPQFENHGEIISYLYNGYCDPNSHRTHDDDFATYSAAKFKIPSKIFFCDLTYELLEWFFMHNESCCYKPDQTSAAGFRLTPDEQTLLKCLSLLGLIVSETGGDFYNDQLIQGLHTIKKEKKLYTWVVFAVQLFIDTRRVVCKELDRCLSETKYLQKWMSATLKQSLHFGLTNAVNDYYKLNSELLQATKTHMELLLEKDFIQDLVDKSCGSQAASYSWGSFYLFRNYPMLVGLITQYFLTKLHEIGIGLGSDQAAIITSIHLYNASQQSGNVPAGLEWIDLERVIEWQGSALVFLGDRPKDPAECFRHFNLVMGISATVFSRDRRGRPTARLHGSNFAIAPRKNRRLKFMSKYADLMIDSRKHAKAGSVRWVSSRAANEPLAMLEMLVAKYLDSRVTEIVGVPLNGKKRSSMHPTVHPLDMISIFKDYLKSDERILRFDLLTFNQRCVELLRKFQAVCIEQSPLDYPVEEYGGDRRLTSCVSHMMAGVLGLERYQPTRLQEVCHMVKDLIETDGDTEYANAISRCFINGDGNKKITEPFATRTEDNLLLPDRAIFGRIIVTDGPPGSEVTIL